MRFIKLVAWQWPVLIHSPQCLTKMIFASCLANKTDLAVTLFTWGKKQMGGNKPRTIKKIVSYQSMTTHPGHDSLKSAESYRHYI